MKKRPHRNKHPRHNAREILDAALIRCQNIAALAALMNACSHWQGEELMNHSARMIYGEAEGLKESLEHFHKFYSR